LAGDDLHISVNLRGGPSKWHITGWLQIVNLEKSHEGDYTCVAQNEFGLTRAAARINVAATEDGNIYLALLLHTCTKVKLYLMLVIPFKNHNYVRTWERWKPAVN